VSKEGTNVIGKTPWV